jgi:hypothetical protein
LIRLPINPPDLSTAIQAERLTHLTEGNIYGAAGRFHGYQSIAIKGDFSLVNDG